MSSPVPNDNLDDLQRLIQSRVEKLRPKLLDITRRNPLISTSFSSRSTSIVRVVDELPDVLAFNLTSGKRMRIAPLPNLDDDPRDELSSAFLDKLAEARLLDQQYLGDVKKIAPADEASDENYRRIERELRDRIRANSGMAPRQSKSSVSLTQHALNHGIAPSYDLPDAADEHSDGRHRDDDIQTLYLPNDLERKLNAISTKCKTWREETGLEVLFIAFGFLEWREPNSSETIFSPLVLLPIRLETSNSAEGREYFVAGYEEPPETNLVLAEKMRTEFGIDFPRYDGASLEKYFVEVSAVSPKSAEWKLRRQIVLGVFPSTRIAMFHDLDTAKHAFYASKVVASLFGGTGDGRNSSFAEEYDVDRPEIEAKVPYLVLDADSSQFSTIVDVLSGRNVSVEGPPGTGKSQTIVNTIAAAIISGKRVLFVAEKMAALEVVKSRLEAVGLGEFVLPLQASRSTREQVVASLRKRLEIASASPPKDFSSQIERFRSARQEIAEYIQALTTILPDTGLTVCEIIGKNIAFNELLAAAPRVVQAPEIPGVRNFTKATIESAANAASKFEAAWRAASTANSHWRGTNVVHLTALSANELSRLSEDAAKKAELAHLSRIELTAFGLDGAIALSNLPEIRQLLAKLHEASPGANPDVMERVTNEREIALLRRFHDGARRCQTYNSKLAGLFRNAGSSDIPKALRRISELCAALHFETLNVSDWTAEAEKRNSGLSDADNLASSLLPFVEAFPSATAISLKVVRHAADVVRASGKVVLSLRAAAPPSAFEGTASRQLIALGINLRATRDSLSATISTHTDLSPEALRTLAAALTSGGAFRSLSASFRRARSAYLTLTKRPKFDSTIAAADLRSLADWKEAASLFVQDEHAKALFARHFRGVDTDFELFDRLATYYETVDSNFPGVSHREVRRLLSTGDLEILSLIPLNLGDSWEGTFRELGDHIFHSKKIHAETVEGIKELKSLIGIFIEPERTLPSALDNLANQFEKFLEAKTTLNSHQLARDILAEHFRGWRTDLGLLEATLNSAEMAIASPLGNRGCAEMLREHRMDGVMTAVQRTLNAEQDLSEALGTLAERSGVDFASRLAAFDLPRKAEILHEASTDREGLFAHSSLATARAALSEFRIQWIAEALEDESREPQDLARVVEAAIYRSLAIAAYQDYGAVLSKFSGAYLDECRTAIANIDREIIRQSRRMIRAGLIGNACPPAGNNTGKKSTWTEMALISNECSKKQRYISIRDLTTRAGRALQAIKPCWMMSPLAVAQYLPKGSGVEFDLCIVDEASQMPPEDAVGALARSAHVTP